MQANPFLGVLLHATGGLAAASFYLPFKGVRNWAWETGWITGGICSWLLAPALFGFAILSGVYHVSLLEIYQRCPHAALAEAFAFGALWGIGGLTFGLSMRYLGIALGYAIALGFCAAFGTLVPPIVAGTFGNLLATVSGRVVLGGVVMCLVGISFSGAAGMHKERELSTDQKKASVAEFHFTRGLIIATLCGLLSACIAFALAAGKPISDEAVSLGTPPLWAGLATLVVILLGGLVTNLVWCTALLLKNGRFGEFVGKQPDQSPVPLGKNYLLCAAAGVTWYLQFFFYTMGSSQMGARFGFSSWTLHMSSIIIFSTVWGVILKEWRGTSLATHRWIAAGLAVLVASTVVVGWGNFLGVGK